MRREKCKDDEERCEEGEGRGVRREKSEEGEG